MASDPPEPGRQRSAGAWAQRLTRLLNRVTSEEAVCELLLRFVIRVVPSRLGAVAVPVSSEALGVVATQGYPLDLVRHIRIPAGAGVIGSVFTSGVPICVTDVSELETARRRPRYRTNSFAAVPIRSGNDVLGVICVTDRLDDAPFTKADVARIRALASPAALALARERQRREAQRFAQAAVVDSLSGLYNRRYFNDRLNEELHRAERDATPVGLLLIDIDDFKEVNDRFGHLAGDSVIREVSAILRQSVRVFDICSRFGGEEFAVLMPGTGAEGAAILAERVRERIASSTPPEWQSKGIRVTVSIGWAIARGMEPQDLVDAADRALYTAKRAGKNRVARGEDPGRT